MLRLKRIEIPPYPGSIYIQSGDILGRTPYRASFHPLDEDVIDCGITLENAGDQIPNHLLRVDNVSKTFIYLSFVNKNPEENVTDSETNENPRKKTFSRDTHKEG
jgi:hypothetical protein